MIYVSNSCQNQTNFPWYNNYFLERNKNYIYNDVEIALELNRHPIKLGTVWNWLFNIEWIYFVFLNSISQCQHHTKVFIWRNNLLQKTNKLQHTKFNVTNFISLDRINSIISITCRLFLSFHTYNFELSNLLTL